MSTHRINQQQEKTSQQWRVTFSYITNIGGHMRRVKGSTRWFDSYDEARGSHWLGEDDSRIETRQLNQ